MAKATSKSAIPVERIAAQIYLIRGESVMLDADLAELYVVETRVLVQAVKRNEDRTASLTTSCFGSRSKSWKIGDHKL